MHKRQAGFSLLDGILIVIILALVGFGWYAFQAKKKAEDTAKKTDTSETKDTVSEKPRPSIPADWVWYENKDLGYAFAHPKAWTITANQPETCPFDAKLYGSASCPLTVKLSPKDFTDDERNSPESSLISGVAYEGVQLVTEANALAFELEQAKSAKATVERQETLQINKQNALYVRVVSAGTTDNIWAVKYPGYYIRFVNRERNTAYYSDGKASFTTDYARYTTTIDRIVKTMIAL